MKIDEFPKRLEQIMDRHEINASSFAEQVGVGRSSISHLLSGRNKPSLDFVLSVLKEFPDVDLYWLLNGKGTYPASGTPKIPSPPSAKIESQTPPQSRGNTAEKTSPPDLFSENKEPSPSQIATYHSKQKGKNVTKVILIYADGTFDSYDQS